MSLITGDEEKKLIKGEAEKNSGGVGAESLNSQANGSIFMTKYLYCIVCEMPGHLPVSASLIQERQRCATCGTITIHRDADYVFDADKLLQEIVSLRNGLTKIYYDNEAACGCECDVETCCNRVGEPCAKCDARAALIIIGTQRPSAVSGDLNVTD